FTSSGLTNPALGVQSTNPAIFWHRTDQSADGKRWQAYVTGGGSWTLATRADDGSSGNTAIQAQRSGLDVTRIAMTAGEIALNGDADFNGNADISGTLAVGGAATF